MLKYSLIIGTLNRPEAIKNCYHSISAQEYTNFEIIIIDQSDDNTTENMIKELNDRRIIYKHVEYKGLSRARNEALKIATGDYFCLIDDDAFYQKDYLNIANEYVDSKTILSGYIFDTIKNSAFLKYRSNLNQKALSMRYVLRTCPSAGLVFPRKVVEDCGCFDERFGVGSIYGAGEETDLLLRAITHGYSVKYIEKLRLKHPIPVPKNHILDANREESYYIGFGALYKKHFSTQLLINGLIELWVRLIIKFILYRGNKRKIAKAQIKGFIIGFKRYGENERKRV